MCSDGYRAGAENAYSYSWDMLRLRGQPDIYANLGYDRTLGYDY